MYVQKEPKVLVRIVGQAPLAATVYPEAKTHRLNVLHAWWPGGLVIGGLLGYSMAEAHVGWRRQ